MNNDNEMILRIIKGFIGCTLLFTSATHADSLEDFANEITVLPSYTSKTENAMGEKITSTTLSEFAYNVGLNVSTLSDNEVNEIASDFGDRPSWSFCDEDAQVEIIFNGNSYLEYTGIANITF